MDIPELAAGYARLQIDLKEERRGEHSPTPGEVVCATELPPEEVGFISVSENTVTIDVVRPRCRHTREILTGLGFVRVIKAPDMDWLWLYIGIGRNHGFTMKRLKKLLDETDSQPVGKIHLNNAYTVVGLREDKFEGACTHMKSAKINGIALKPRQATFKETQEEDPRYFKRGDNDKRAEEKNNKPPKKSFEKKTFNK